MISRSLECPERTTIFLGTHTAEFPAPTRTHTQHVVAGDRGVAVHRTVRVQASDLGVCNWRTPHEGDARFAAPVLSCQ